MVGGAALMLTPRVVSQGVFSVFPTTALLLLEPYFHEDGFEVCGGMSGGMGSTPPTSRISRELSRREAAMNMEDWQWRLYLKHADLIQTRPRWPRGVLVSYRSRVPSWLTPTVAAGSTGVSKSMWMSVGPHERESPGSRESASEYVIEHHLRNMYLEAPDESGRSRYRCVGGVFDPFPTEVKGIPKSVSYVGHVAMDVVDTPEEAIRADKDASIREALVEECRWLTVFRPETHLGRPGPRLSLKTSGYSLPTTHALGLSVEIRRDGQTVMTGMMSDPRDRVYFPLAAHVELGQWMYEDYQMDPSMARWDAVIRGDARASLWDIDKSMYWSGEFVVPVRYRP
jgi:hypothetical protein